MFLKSIYVMVYIMGTNAIAVRSIPASFWAIRHSFFFTAATGALCAWRRSRKSPLNTSS